MDNHSHSAWSAMFYNGFERVVEMEVVEKMSEMAVVERIVEMIV